MTTIPVPGVITSAITMSDRGDEIDFETVGNDETNVQTNVFYKAIPEYAIHSTIAPIGSSGALWHDYTVDWTSTSITWSVDGKAVRTYFKNSSTAVSPATPPGERWFPTTASKLQVAVWDDGDAAWGGGPIPWGDDESYMASFAYIDVTCYDDKDRPVDSWPSGTTKPTTNPGLSEYSLNYFQQTSSSKPSPSNQIGTQYFSTSAEFSNAPIQQIQVVQLSVLTLLIYFLF